jgi:hypothetical protein
MNVLRYAMAAVFIYIFSFLTISAGEQKILFREDFNDLTNWKPLYFPKIEKHSSYGIHTDGNTSFLKAVSKDSASALMYKKLFNIYEYPFIKWCWKVENVYKNGDAKTKEGDDYPLRIYIMFKYDPKKAGFFEKLKYKTAKLVYGQYPPHSSLNYIWSNNKFTESIITSSYTKKSKMIPLQSGIMKVGTWQNEKVDIVKDYQRAFGTTPPAEASIAIMNDSDNTGESSVSYLDYIEVYRENGDNNSQI